MTLNKRWIHNHDPSFPTSHSRPEVLLSLCLSQQSCSFLLWCAQRDSVEVAANIADVNNARSISDRSDSNDLYLIVWYQITVLWADTYIVPRLWHTGTYKQTKGYTVQMLTSFSSSDATLPLLCTSWWYLSLFTVVRLVGACISITVIHFAVAWTPDSHLVSSNLSIPVAIATLKLTALRIFQTTGEAVKSYYQGTGGNAAAKHEKQPNSHV